MHKKRSREQLEFLIADNKENMFPINKNVKPTMESFMPYRPSSFSSNLLILNIFISKSSIH